MRRYQPSTEGRLSAEPVLAASKSHQLAYETRYLRVPRMVPVELASPFSVSLIGCGYPREICDESPIHITQAEEGPQLGLCTWVFEPFQCGRSRCVYFQFAWFDGMTEILYSIGEPFAFRES